MCKGEAKLGPNKTPCAYCDGTGVTWTEEGANLMAFLRKNLTMKPN